MSLLAIAYSLRHRSRDTRHVFGRSPRRTVRSQTHSVGKRDVLGWSEMLCLGFPVLENLLAVEW